MIRLKRGLDLLHNLSIQDSAFLAPLFSAGGHFTHNLAGFRGFPAGFAFGGDLLGHLVHLIPEILRALLGRHFRAGIFFNLLDIFLHRLAKALESLAHVSTHETFKHGAH